MPVKRRKPKVRIEGFPDWQIEVFGSRNTAGGRLKTWKGTRPSLPPGDTMADDRTEHPVSHCLDSVSCAHYGAVDQKLPWLPAITRMAGV